MSRPPSGTGRDPFDVYEGMLDSVLDTSSLNDRERERVACVVEGKRILVDCAF